MLSCNIVEVLSVKNSHIMLCCSVKEEELHNTTLHQSKDATHQSAHQLKWFISDHEPTTEQANQHRYMPPSLPTYQSNLFLLHLIVLFNAVQVY